MYYSAYDLQISGYFQTGRNSKSEKECLESMVEYFGIDNDASCTENMTKKELKEWVCTFWVRIHKHKRKLPEAKY